MAHASEVMPYFINPSKNLNEEEKVLAYQKCESELDALLTGETDVILKMVTINCVFKSHMPYFYWTGFYCVHKNDQLIVGPYQGTLGCFYINFKKGVCGTVAATKKTKIVDDVHALTEGEDHIACDPNSQSEIVLPVFDNKDNLIAVFDVDSSIKNSFDRVDQSFIERILLKHFAQNKLTQNKIVM